MVTVYTSCFDNQSLRILYLWVSYDSQFKTAIIFLNGINQLIFIMVKCGVPFEVGLISYIGLLFR
jgi:hypothetical protein